MAKRPPVRVYEVPESVGRGAAVSPPSPGPRPSTDPAGRGREFGGVSPRVEDEIRGLPPKNRKKMKVQDYYRVVFGPDSGAGKSKAQMVEELMDFIQDTQGDFRGDATAAQEWSKKNLSADTRNRLLSAWQGVRTERNQLGRKAGHARQAGRLDAVEKYSKQFEYYDDFAREFSGQPIVSGVRREVSVDIRDTLRAMPDERLAALGVRRFLAPLLGVAGTTYDLLYSPPAEAETLYGSEFESTADAMAREEALAGGAEFLAEQPGYSERPPWADPGHYGRQRFGGDDEALQEQMPSTRMIREGEWK